MRSLEGGGNFCQIIKFCVLFSIWWSRTEVLKQTSYSKWSSSSDLIAPISKLRTALTRSWGNTRKLGHAEFNRVWNRPRKGQVDRGRQVSSLPEPYLLLLIKSSLFRNTQIKDLINLPSWFVLRLPEENLSITFLFLMRSAVIVLTLIRRAFCKLFRGDAGIALENMP